MATDSRFPSELTEEQRQRRAGTARWARLRLWSTLSYQLLAAILFLGLSFVPAPFFFVLFMYFLGLLGTEALGIQQSVNVLRVQRQVQREQPGLPGPIGPGPILGGLIGTLFWVIVIGAWG